jgi:hypothetical protein
MQKKVREPPIIGFVARLSLREAALKSFDAAQQLLLNSAQSVLISLGRPLAWRRPAKVSATDGAARLSARTSPAELAYPVIAA